ncbi:MAG: DUF6036 family nucleotidyltransferase [Planctomycetota bacterium]
MDEIELPADFKEFFELLNSEKVEYLLVGGFAVALHGYVRSTSDIDAWVAATEENAPKVVTVLRRFGFSHDSAKESMFKQEGKVFQIGLPPMRIDLLTKVSGVDFATAYSRREAKSVGNLTLQVISLEDLRANKLASGRNKDLADLDNLPEA